MDGITAVLIVIIYLVIIYFSVKEGGKKNIVKDNKPANMLIGGLLGFLFGFIGLIILWIIPNDDRIS